jgi:hypothetical protein
MPPVSEQFLGMAVTNLYYPRTYSNDIIRLNYVAGGAKLMPVNREPDAEPVPES